MVALYLGESLEAGEGLCVCQGELWGVEPLWS